MDHTAAHAQAEGQQHPVAIYMWVWGLLFVVSTFSYLSTIFTCTAPCAGR